MYCDQALRSLNEDRIYTVKQLMVVRPPIALRIEDRMGQEYTRLWRLMCALQTTVVDEYAISVLE